MTKEPLISIIVPVYNTEKYLCRCIESIIAQSFTEWECLLIDDGSTDGSPEICDEYATKDSRIKVFHKVNEGVSSARNIGIDNAKGRFVTFVDADDSISQNFLCIIKEGDFDLLISSYLLSNGIEPDKIADGDYEDTDIKHFFELYLANLQLRTPWAKVFKREIIDGLRFNEQMHLGEDTLFCLFYYKRCNSLKICNSYSYIYTSSDTKKKYKLDIDTVLHTFHQLSMAYTGLGLNSPLFNNFLYGWFLYMIEDSKEGLLRWYSDPVVRNFYFHHLAKTLRHKVRFYKNWLQIWLS